VGPFQAAAREWHPANALHLARWSERAYLNAGDAGIAELAQSGDYETHLVDLRDHGEQRQHSSDGQVLVAWNDSVVIAAFRGTEGDQLRDLTTDGDIVRFSPHWLNEARGALSAANDSGASSLDLRLHRGFATSENELWNHGLAETLERAGAADKAFWLTGHSLGGALATMTALRLWVEYIAEPRPDRCLPQGLITYGQPAVGDFACAEFLDRRLGRSYWRVINNRDAVPHLPSPALGYHHAGQVALINQRGRLQLEAGLISRIADFLPADFNLQQLVGELVDDHRMPGYLAGLGGRPGTSA
jgi:triacylglycerol lipase